MTKLRFDRVASSDLRCGMCGKNMPKGTEVYLIKPTDWRKAWASHVSGCKECAEK